eukprot:6197783-Pleurochrysis_carterae.AAC.1
MGGPRGARRETRVSNVHSCHPPRQRGFHRVHPPDLHEGSGRGGCPAKPGAHTPRAQGRRGGQHRWPLGSGAQTNLSREGRLVS